MAQLVQVIAVVVVVVMGGLTMQDDFPTQHERMRIIIFFVLKEVWSRGKCRKGRQ
jgi:hypothetical protein